jgi:aminoglycoside phosphotransferase (APT) family kinase protein
MGALHDDEVEVDDDAVAALVRTQLPELASRSLRRVSTHGTDNVIYRCGDDLAVRLPRIGWAVGQVEHEHTWLPQLAPHLPAPVPLPVAVGEPGLGYPYRWLVYRWLAGRDAMSDGHVDWVALARELASFVTALHDIDPAGAPTSTGRGAPLEPEDESVRAAIEHLGGEIDTGRALDVWEAALAAGPWTAHPVWVHGDLLPGNVIVTTGRLAGIIDWASSGLGDPACDAMIAWAMPPAARDVFRDALGLDDATWQRARGWTVQQAVQFIPYYRTSLPDAVAAARTRLDAVLA